MNPSLYETLAREVSDLELENARLFCAYKENEILLAKKRHEMVVAMLSSDPDFPEPVHSYEYGVVNA